jgi:hypothetical protein
MLLYQASVLSPNLIIQPVKYAAKKQVGVVIISGFKNHEPNAIVSKVNSITCT